MPSKAALGMLCGLGLFGCSSGAPMTALSTPITVPLEAAPPPPAPAPTPTAAPAAAPPRQFAGALSTDAVVALTQAGSPVSKDLIEPALSGLATEALGCLTDGEELEGRVWFVARVATTGALEEIQVPATDATPDQMKCLNAVIGKAKASPPSAPLALSFTLAFHADPMPVDATKGVTMSGSDPLAPTKMWGETTGDAFGPGGLGLSGIGESAGGRGEGIGLGSIGTLGHGSGTGQGFGNGHGRLGSDTRGKAPSIKVGATSVSGRLPPEVIQRIVRQSFGRFRLCYENGLRNKPSLAGKVEVDFTIAADGSVTDVKRGKTTNLPDAGVIGCVQRSFGGLSFPQPEGGIVKVAYPIAFAPGDGATKTKPAAHTAFTIKTKKKLAEVDPATIAALFESDKAAAVVTLDGDHTPEHQKGMPFAVFVRTGADEVFVARRLRSNAKGFEPVVSGAERITPDNWSLRVEGPASDISQALLGSLLDP